MEVPLHDHECEDGASQNSDMGEIDLSTPTPAAEQPGGPASLLRQVALGGAAARIVSSMSQTAALLPLSQKVGAVGGSVWERSSAVRSTLKAVRRPNPDPGSSPLDTSYYFCYSDITLKFTRDQS